jgi:hypothetical protein
MESVVATVLLSLSSGAFGAIAGVVISIFYYRRSEKRRWKLDTLKRLAAHRFAIAEGRSLERSDEFFVVLNEVFVVFHDAPKVLDAIEVMHKETGMPGRLHDNVVKLFKAMCDDLDINHRALNDSFFLSPFTPGGDSTSLDSPGRPQLPS